jgi:pyridoxine 5-phosphate synthase
MVKLSVNINKIATLRNSRGGNNPDLIQVAKDCERFGAHGITVHPRPDERHVKFVDVYALKKIVTTELNIEGNPQHGYMDLVLATKPTQATLVPDAIGAITSNAGWDTITHQVYLADIVSTLKKNGIRTSIFVDPVAEMVEGAAKTGTDRIEFYTENYAKEFLKNPVQAIESYKKCAVLARYLGLGINAGHDLDLKNLSYFCQNIPHLLEVSIGHALICNALYYGLENTIQLYLRQLKQDISV